MGNDSNGFPNPHVNKAAIPTRDSQTWRLDLLAGEEEVCCTGRSDFSISKMSQER